MKLGLGVLESSQRGKRKETRASIKAVRYALDLNRKAREFHKTNQILVVSNSCMIVGKGT